MIIIGDFVLVCSDVEFGLPLYVAVGGVLAGMLALAPKRPALFFSVPWWSTSPSPTCCSLWALGLPSVGFVMMFKFKESEVQRRQGDGGQRASCSHRRTKSLHPSPCHSRPVAHLHQNHMEVRSVMLCALMSLLSWVSMHHQSWGARTDHFMWRMIF